MWNRLWCTLLYKRKYSKFKIELQKYIFMQISKSFGDIHKPHGHNFSFSLNFIFEKFWHFDAFRSIFDQFLTRFGPFLTNSNHHRYIFDSHFDFFLNFLTISWPILIIFRPILIIVLPILIIYWPYLTIFWLPYSVTIHKVYE